MVVGKRIALVILGFFLAALPLAAQTGEITLLHVSDSHSHLAAWGSKDVFFNENLGVPELKILRSLGLDAFVLGNHEFRLGPDLLVSVLQSAGPDGGVPILATNINPIGHALGSWIQSGLIKDVNGVKVGLFGVTIHKNALLNPAPVVITKITVRLFVAQKGELGLATSNRIRDVAAIPRAVKAVLRVPR